MFARLFAVASLAALAVASPAPLALRGECDTGTITCCDSVHSTDAMSNALSQYGLASMFAGLEPGTLSGSNCSPFSGVGVGGGAAQCGQQPLCCNNNKFSGAVVIGCSPINIGL